MQGLRLTYTAEACDSFDTPFNERHSVFSRAFGTSFNDDGLLWIMTQFESSPFSDVALFDEERLLKYEYGGSSLRRNMNAYCPGVFRDLGRFIKDDWCFIVGLNKSTSDLERTFEELESFADNSLEASTSFLRNADYSFLNVDGFAWLCMAKSERFVAESRARCAELNGVQCCGLSVSEFIEQLKA